MNNYFGSVVVVVLLLLSLIWYYDYISTFTLVGLSVVVAGSAYYAYSTGVVGGDDKKSLIGTVASAPFNLAKSAYDATGEVASSMVDTTSKVMKATGSVISAPTKIVGSIAETIDKVI